MMGLDVTAWGVFAAGLLSFASPCVLPLVPAFLAFVAGVSIDQLAEDGGKRPSGRILVSAAAFVAGFTTVFVALGATASAVGKALTAYLAYFGYAAGAVIVVLGLHFLGLVRIPLLFRTARVEVGRKPAGLLGAYVVGLAFAFGWTPCVGPVLTAILMLAGTEDSVGQGALLLLVYALGLGVPFLLAALFAGRFMRWAAQARPYVGYIEKVLGALLVITGLLFITGQMTTISYWLLETFPALGRIG